MKERIMSHTDVERPRLLIVDDEAAIVAAARSYLTSHGYRVDGAGEREEAEAMLATTRYELVVLDMRMTGAHGREGLELLSYVRERCPWTRAVVLTAYGSTELEEEARRRGALAFLQKPVPLAELALTADLLLEAGD
jgi:DNA-binding NtrC family response regulator